jgi:hypothetical protein
MTLRFVALFACALLLSACEEKLGPEAFAHVGAYHLEEVNGEALPWVAEGRTEEVTEGIFTLNADNTFTHEIHWILPTSDGANPTSEVRSGRYRIFRNQLSFEEDNVTSNRPSVYNGAIDDNTLILAATGFFAVYRR